MYLFIFEMRTFLSQRGEKCESYFEYFILWDNLVYVLYVTCAVNWRDDMRSGSHGRRGNIRGKCVKV